MSALNLADNTVITRDIESSAPPAPGTQAHRNLVGKLAFFTALGVPDKLDTTGDGQFDVALRDIDPLANRGKASNNGWSGCASCHDDGHSDNAHVDLRDRPAPDHSARRHVRAQQPRRSAHPQLERGARLEHGLQQQRTRHPGRHRLRDQCRTAPIKSALVFNHGPTRGISDSLDAMSEWVATVRAPIMPAIAANTEANGRAVFTTNCASCHGGAKWTKSRTSGCTRTIRCCRRIRSARRSSPAVRPRTTRASHVAGPQVVSVTRAGKPTLLDARQCRYVQPGESGSRSAAPRRWPGRPRRASRPSALGGFNSPSLLGVAYSGPYFHDGSSHTLEDVAARHNARGAPARSPAT